MHDEAQTLLNVMNVFITEPLLDWTKPAGIYCHAHALAMSHCAIIFCSIPVDPQRLTASATSRSGSDSRSGTPSASDDGSSARTIAASGGPGEDVAWYSHRLHYSKTRSYATHVVLM